MVVADDEDADEEADDDMDEAELVDALLLFADFAFRFNTAAETAEVDGCCFTMLSIMPPALVVER